MVTAQHGTDLLVLDIAVSDTQCVQAVYGLKNSTITGRQDSLSSNISANSFSFSACQALLQGSEGRLAGICTACANGCRAEGEACHCGRSH